MTRQADPVDRIRGAQVRIYAVDKKTVIGSGFLVGRREVVTCTHVVARALYPSDDAPEPPPEPPRSDRISFWISPFWRRTGL
jgi:hypothetical protein